MTWESLAGVSSTLVALTAALLVFLQGRAATKADTIQRTIDQLQEQVASLRSEVHGLRREVRVLDDYAHLLRRTHPEPPPWPDVLTMKGKS